MENETQFFKNILEGCVMKIISVRPCYLQEVAKHLFNYGLGIVREGTLLPLLLKLEKLGYLDSKKVPSSNGPCGKYYTINTNGKMYLTNFCCDWKDFSCVVNKLLNDEGGGEND